MNEVCLSLQAEERIKYDMLVCFYTVIVTEKKGLPGSKGKSRLKTVSDYRYEKLFLQILLYFTHVSFEMAMFSHVPNLFLQLFNITPCPQDKRQ